jgi:Transposase DDE domain
MVKTQRWQSIPTQLELAEFEQFVLPHLSVGSRGPAPKLSLYKIFNYILKILYLGCQWKELPIDKDVDGRPETHYTRIYRISRRWVDSSWMDAIFASSVSRFHQDNLLDTTVIHGDGTTTAAKKGGDKLGFSGHKKMKGDKVVAFCDRHCNVIAPFVVAPGNRNESPLLREALRKVIHLFREVGLDLQGSIVSLDGVYDCRANRKAIFNRGMVPNINPTRAAESSRSGAASQSSSPPSSKSAFGRSSECLPGRTSSAGSCCASNASAGCTTRSRPLPTR